jgi:hypothetical protein
MTAFKKTILGKILKGVVKVAPIAIGAASFLIPAIGPAVGTSLIAKTAAKLIGTIKGSVGGQIVGGIAKTVGTVAKSAINLVTGTTADERAQVKEVKAEASAAQDQLDQVQRLIDAGATRAQAEQMAGVTAKELGSADSAQKDLETAGKLLGITPEQEAAAKAAAVTAATVTAGAGGCAAIGGDTSAFLLVLGILIIYFAVKLIIIFNGKRQYK